LAHENWNLLRVSGKKNTVHGVLPKSSYKRPEVRRALLKTVSKNYLAALVLEMTAEYSRESVTIVIANRQDRHPTPAKHFVRIACIEFALQRIRRPVPENEVSSVRDGGVRSAGRDYQDSFALGYRCDGENVAAYHVHDDEIDAMLVDDTAKC
jgi:hypothetical protein